MLCSLLVSWLLLADPKTTVRDASPPAVVPIHRVRALASVTKDIVADASRRSATVRQLIAELDQTDVIVYIDLQFDLARAQGKTTFITANAAGRFLRIVIDAMLSAPRRQEILGHELQHALEIAVSDAADHDGVRRLYERIGKRVDGREHFETSAAALAGRRVWSELHELNAVSWSK